MFDKILIANRGEIAARVARTCKRLGIPCAAVYSEADEGAPHTQLADEAHCIGPAHVTKSYLNADAILAVADETGADAIHPGYGLLSENPEFVERVREAGLTFIGPSADVMRLMGDKAAARDFARNQDVPVVPGSDGPIDSEELAVEFATEFGYPLLVKAAAGGGGIGMKLATKEKKLRKAFQACQRRGESAFGNPAVYLERYIEKPRHIEIQVFGDSHGNHVHLFERECSVQRRHQKVIEEAPSPAMKRFSNLRQRMTEAAVRLATAADYQNAGTVEFIFSDQTDEFFFIEMNTRLQVEHPVTEMITGYDLVEWQIRVAAGEELPATQDEITFDGHAIECRIYAENPKKRFMPAPGEIGEYSEPSGDDVRVDSGVTSNFKVTPFYDPMVAKVVAKGEDRDAARYTMLGALGEMKLEGLTTNLEMHRWILQHEDFVEGHVHTAWLEEQ
jgi:acetyl-CoA carboxylase biotin carboxylase subunit